MRLTPSFVIQGTEEYQGRDSCRPVQSHRRKKKIFLFAFLCILEHIELMESHLCFSKIFMNPNQV